MHAIKAKAKRFRDWIQSSHDRNVMSIGGQWAIDTTHMTRDSIIYSAGVGNGIPWELELVHRYGCKVILLDPSPTGKHTIEKLIDEKKLPEQIHFLELGLASQSGAISFCLPENSAEGSFKICKEEDQQDLTFECIRISDLLTKFQHTHIDILKMDIEGFEYGVLDEIFSTNLMVKQICLEFHSRVVGIPQKRIRDYVKKLSARGYHRIYRKDNDMTFIKRQ